MCSWRRSGVTQQQERLAQLIEDNAFINVEKVLSGGGDGNAGCISSNSRVAPMMADATEGDGAVADDEVRQALAVLDASRVSLTSSLVDQHKAYLESVRQAVAEANEFTSRSSDEEEDDEDEDDDVPHNGPETMGLREKSSATAGPRKRRRPCAASARATKASKALNAKKRSVRHPPTPSLHASDVDAVECRLRSELHLLQQWSHAMAEPLPMVNGIFTPSIKTSSTRAVLPPPPSGCAALVPYPMVQLCALCPSYEAMTASPVVRASSGRRGDPQNLGCETGVFSLGKHHDADASYANIPPLLEGISWAKEHHLCSVCMLPAAYRCARCRTALFCSIDCHVMHDATRCLKFTV